MDSFAEDLAEAKRATEKKKPGGKWRVKQQNTERQIVALLRAVERRPKRFEDAARLRGLCRSWNDLGHRIRVAGGDSPRRVDLQALYEEAMSGEPDTGERRPGCA